MTDKLKLLSSESIILQNEELGLLLTNINIVEVRTKGVFKPVDASKRYPISKIKELNGKAQVEVEETWIHIHFKNNEKKSFELEKNKEAHQWANEINKLVTGAELEPMPIDKAEIFNSAVAESKDTGKAMGEAVLGVIPLPGTKFLGRTVGGIVGGVVGGSVKGVSEIIRSGKQQQATTTESSPQPHNTNKDPNKCQFCSAPISSSAGRSVRCSYCNAVQH